MKFFKKIDLIFKNQSEKKGFWISLKAIAVCCMLLSFLSSSVWITITVFSFFILLLKFMDTKFPGKLGIKFKAPAPKASLSGTYTEYLNAINGVPIVKNDDSTSSSIFSNDSAFSNSSFSSPYSSDSFSSNKYD